MPDPPSQSERDRVQLVLSRVAVDDWLDERNSSSLVGIWARSKLRATLLTLQPEPALGAGIAELVAAIRQHEHERWPWIVKQDARLYAVAGLPSYRSSLPQPESAPECICPNNGMAAACPIHGQKLVDPVFHKPAPEPVWPDGSTEPKEAYNCTACGWLTRTDPTGQNRCVMCLQETLERVEVIPSPVHSGEEDG